MKSQKPNSLLRSFQCACIGVFYALTHERNLRIHFAAGAFALYVSRYYALSKTELAVLIFCVGLVLVCEMINTAIETTVDIETRSFHPLARVAKDVAAGAVLVSAATSVAVGFLLFWDIPTLRQIGREILARPVPWLLAGAVALVWVILPQRLHPPAPCPPDRGDST